MTVAVAVQARRRARSLGAGAAGAPGVLARAEVWLIEQLTALALPVDAARVATYVPATTLVLGAAVYGLLGVAGVVLLVAVSVAGVVVLRRGAARRRTVASERALPGVLDAVARQLRAGGSLAQAIAAADPPKSAPDLCASWSRLRDLVPMVGVAAALERWMSATPSRAVRLAGAALSLAASTGGSPARAIDGVAATLRSRTAVADEVRALSSQARASAAVIALSPLVFAALAGATDDRTREVLASPSGLGLLVVGLGLDAVGAAWMARLCRPATP